MNIDKALNRMISGQKNKSEKFKKQTTAFKFNKSMFHPKPNVPIKKADGKKVYYYDTTNVPSPKVLDKIYKKIPDNKNIPVVLETKKQYLNEYIKNQELVNGSPFSKSEKKEYTKEELVNMKGVVSRYTTKKNKYIDPRVVFFTDRKWTPKELEFSAWHEYAHEKLENQPKLLDKYSQNFSPNKAVSQYGKEAGAEEDFADRYAMNHTQMRFDNTSKNSLFKKVRENNKESVYRDPFKRKIVIKKEELHLLPGEEEELVDSYSYLLDSSSPKLYKGSIYIKSINPLIVKEFKERLKDIKSVSPPKSIFLNTKIMRQNDKENNREEELSNNPHLPYINRLRNRTGYITEYNPKDIANFWEAARKQQEEIQNARSDAYEKYKGIGGTYRPSGKEKGITSYEHDNFNRIKGVLHHEIGHSKGKQSFDKYNDNYDAFMKKTDPRNALTIYGKTNTHEDFAESFAGYLDKDYKRAEFVEPPKEAKIVRADLMNEMFGDIKSGKSGREIEEEKLNPFELIKDKHGKNLSNLTYTGGESHGRNFMNPFSQASKIGINYIMPEEDEKSKSLVDVDYLNSYTTSNDIYNPYSSMPGINYNIPEGDKVSLNMAKYSSEAEEDAVLNKLNDYNRRINETKGKEKLKLQIERDAFINTLKYLNLDIKTNNQILEQKPVNKPKLVFKNEATLTPKERARQNAKRFREQHPDYFKQRYIARKNSFNINVPQIKQPEEKKEVEEKKERIVQPILAGKLGSMGFVQAKNVPTKNPINFIKVKDEFIEDKGYEFPYLRGNAEETLLKIISRYGENGINRDEISGYTNMPTATLNAILNKLVRERLLVNSNDRGTNKKFFLRSEDIVNTDLLGLFGPRRGELKVKSEEEQHKTKHQLARKRLLEELQEQKNKEQIKIVEPKVETPVFVIKEEPSKKEQIIKEKIEKLMEGPSYPYENMTFEELFAISKDKTRERAMLPEEKTIFYRNYYSKKNAIKKDSGKSYIKYDYNVKDPTTSDDLFKIADEIKNGKEQVNVNIHPIAKKPVIDWHRQKDPEQRRLALEAEKLRIQKEHLERAKQKDFRRQSKQELIKSEFDDYDTFVKTNLYEYDRYNNKQQLRNDIDKWKVYEGYAQKTMKLLDSNYVPKNADEKRFITLILNTMELENQRENELEAIKEAYRDDLLDRYTFEVKINEAKRKYDNFLDKLENPPEYTKAEFPSSKSALIKENIGMPLNRPIPASDIVLLNEEQKQRAIQAEMERIKQEEAIERKKRDEHQSNVEDLIFLPLNLITGTPLTKAARIMKNREQKIKQEEMKLKQQEYDKKFYEEQAAKRSSEEEKILKSEEAEEARADYEQRLKAYRDEQEKAKN